MGLPWFLGEHSSEQIVKVLDTLEIGGEVEMHGSNAIIAETLVRNRYAVCDRIEKSFANGRVERVSIASPQLEDLGRSLLSQLRGSEP